MNQTQEPVIDLDARERWIAGCLRCRTHLQVLARTAGFQPETALTVGVIALFLLDLVWRRRPARRAFLTAATMLVLALAALLLTQQPEQSTRLFNGLLASDRFATFLEDLRAFL